MDRAKRGGFLPSIHMLTPHNFKKNKMRTKHPVFFFFGLLLQFSLTSPATALTISGNTISGDVLHFRPNPTRKYQKTQIQPQKLILMPQKSFLITQNSILMPQKSFLDSKLKPRF
jgi:hypothetical protein